MKFLLVDRISQIVPGQRIVAHKALSLAEEYLADHFPRFPVLPGVLMLEALVQASAWLVRVTQDFAFSLVLLKEARNVTYKSFVLPGQVLTVEAQCRELGERESLFSAAGQVQGQPMLKAQLTLRHLNLAETDAAWKPVDDRLRAHWKALYGLIRHEAGAGMTGA